MINNATELRKPHFKIISGLRQGVYDQKIEIEKKTDTIYSVRHIEIGFHSINLKSFDFIKR